jgi:hypothetical protein
MPATSPFDLLAEELGAVAGRVEREVALRVTALAADLERRYAEKELQLERLQKQLEAVVGANVVTWDQRITAKLAMLKDGKDGADGKAGQDGATGPAGPAGEPGAAGEQGAPGVQGMPGAPGACGETGAAGKDGLDGAMGLAGKDGAPGKLPKVKAFKDGAVHYDGEVVTFRGGLYQALQDTATQPHTADWICLAVAGLDGSNGRDGKSLTIRDTYDPKEKYAALDVVTLDYKWFVARYENPGDCPGPGWKAGPGIGKTGKAGPPGERGMQGERGAAAPDIIDWEIDKNAYTVIPVFSNYKKGPPLPLRELFAQFQMEAS